MSSTEELNPTQLNMVLAILTSKDSVSFKTPPSNTPVINLMHQRICNQSPRWSPDYHHHPSEWAYQQETPPEPHMNTCTHRTLNRELVFSICLCFNLLSSTSSNRPRLPPLIFYSLTPDSNSFKCLPEPLKMRPQGKYKEHKPQTSLRHTHSHTHARTQT